MSDGEHRYTVKIVWTGDRGKGTANYRAYGRDHLISAEGKPDIPGSADGVMRLAGTRKTCWSPRSRPATSSGICIFAP